MAKTVLDLDALTDPSFVKVGDQEYRLVLRGELSVFDTNRLERLGKRYDAIKGAAEDPTDDEVRELTTLIDEMSRIVLKAPNEIHDRLTDQQRLRVLGAFSLLSGPKTIPASPAGAVDAEAGLSSGEKSSRA